MSGRQSNIGKDGRSKKGPRHVRLHHWLLNTPAYRSLSVGARALLVELYALHNGDNNGQLFLAERDAGESLGVNRKTARKYLKELVDRGFTRIAHKGSFDLKASPATVWILTEFEYAGQLATKDFTRWRPENGGAKLPPAGPKNTRARGIFTPVKRANGAGFYPHEA